MNYQTVSSTKEGREELLGNLIGVLLTLFCILVVYGILMYEEGVGLTSWAGVGLAGLSGALLAITFIHLNLKKGQGTQTAADFGHGIIAIKHGDLWGVFAAERQELILPFEFTYVTVVSRDRYSKPEYLELTNNDGVVSLYSLSGWRMVIPPQFKEIVVHGRNLCSVKGEDGWGVWSLKMDKLVMPTEYPGCQVWHRCHDFVGVPNGNNEEMKWAIFSFEDQRVVTPYISDRIEYLGNGVFKLQKGKRKRRSDNYHLRFGLYLHGPRIVIKPTYSSIEQFEPGLLELQKDGRLGLFSTTAGQLVVPVRYQSIKRCSRDELELTSHGKKKSAKLLLLKAA